MVRFGALLAVALAASCNGSDAPRNGEIVAHFKNGLQLVDPHDGARRAMPGTRGGFAPTWSPDGRWIAYTRNRLVHDKTQDAIVGDLYVIRPDGTAKRLVARNAEAPTWSPDGKAIAFMRFVCAEPPTCAGVDNPYELFMVEVDSGGARRLSFNRDLRRQPIMVARRRLDCFRGDYGLSLMRPDGTRGPRLTRKWFNANPSWSPDGKLLAFDDFNDVYVVAAPGGRAHRLTPNPGPDFHPVWSPDGRLIAYLSNHICAQRSGCTAHEPMQVWVMNRDGANSKAVTGYGWGPPSWGPQRRED